MTVHHLLIVVCIVSTTPPIEASPSHQRPLHPSPNTSAPPTTPNPMPSLSPRQSTHPRHRPSTPTANSSPPTPPATSPSSPHSPTPPTPASSSPPGAPPSSPRPPISSPTATRPSSSPCRAEHAFSFSPDDDDDNNDLVYWGDHNGLLGALARPAGAPVAFDAATHTLSAPAAGPALRFLARADSGRVAGVARAAADAQTSEVLLFASGEGVAGGARRVVLPGRAAQLVAGTGTFLLRMESGSGGAVYSWGDARYGSLGRGIDEVGAERPGVVEALGGLRVRKLVCGGWIGAAVSEDAACYVWGQNVLGSEGEGRMRCLREAGGGEVALVQILPSEEEAAEPLDVLDVGVGDNHIVVLAEGNRVFVCGGNRNGELGLGDDAPVFVEDWTEVGLLPSPRSRITAVHCGPKATFLAVCAQSRDAEESRPAVN